MVCYPSADGKEDYFGGLKMLCAPLLNIVSSLYYNYICSMNTIRFQWDSNKNRANIKKHKVSFEEAKSVFFDEDARLISDPEHSSDEERFIILGVSSKLKLLVVVHAYMEDDETIRIISARKATKSETKFYYEVK